MTPTATNLERLAEIDRRVTALLEELPGLWVTSEEIAECVDISLKVASRCGIRLARAGALVQRTVFWTSARSRRRDRYEFCYEPNGGLPWRQRLPQWLEPVAYPINPLHCRRIRGRAAQNLSEETRPMTDNEYRELPRHIRERFSSISDSEFDEHPDVLEARQSIEEAEARHQANIDRVSTYRLRLQDLEEQRGQALHEIRSLTEKRTRQLADLLLQRQAVDLSPDKDLQALIERHQLFTDAVDTAKPAIEQRIKEAARAVSMSGPSCTSAEEHLRGVLDRLRLEEAHRRAA